MTFPAPVPKPIVSRLFKCGSCLAVFWDGTGNMQTGQGHKGCLTSPKGFWILEPPTVAPIKKQGV